MEPVVVIIGHHVLSSGNHKMLVMTEPDAVQNQGVEPVHHAPESISRKRSAPKSSAAVHIPHQQSQKHAEHQHSRYLLDIESRPSWPVAGIHQPQFVAPFDNGRRIIEDGLYGIPGHQEHKEREQPARYDGLNEEGHTKKFFDVKCKQNGRKRKQDPFKIW